MCDFFKRPFNSSVNYKTAFTSKHEYFVSDKKNGENTHPALSLGSSMYIDTLCLASLDMQHSCHKDAPVRTDHLRKKARLKSRKVSCDLRKFSCFSSVRRLLWIGTAHTGWTADRSKGWRWPKIREFSPRKAVCWWRKEKRERKSAIPGFSLNKCLKYLVGLVGLARRQDSFTSAWYAVEPREWRCSRRLFYIFRERTSWFYKSLRWADKILSEE